MLLFRCALHSNFLRWRHDRCKRWLHQRYPSSSRARSSTCGHHSTQHAAQCGAALGHGRQNCSNQRTKLSASLSLSLNAIVSSAMLCKQLVLLPKELATRQSKLKGTPISINKSTGFTPPDEKGSYGDTGPHFRAPLFCKTLRAQEHEPPFQKQKTCSVDDTHATHTVESTFCYKFGFHRPHLYYLNTGMVPSTPSFVPWHHEEELKFAACSNRGLLKCSVSRGRPVKSKVQCFDYPKIARYPKPILASIISPPWTQNIYKPYPPTSLKTAKPHEKREYVLPHPQQSHAHRKKKN